MDTTIRLLMESRIDEVKKRVALDTLASQLEDKLSQIKGYSHHKLSITPNYDDACVDIIFKDNNDMCRVYPQKTKISNENSNKVIKVSSIDGAYIEGNKVYDEDGTLIGDALVRMKAIHNKSDYSDSLDDAEIKINSKLSSMRKLEKYLASEAINNMK